MTTPIYELCDAYVEHLAQLDPVGATSRGIVGYDDKMTDYSPEGVLSRTELDRRTLAQLDELSPENERDRIAADLLAERLGSSIALAEAGETMRTLRVLGSPFQAVRGVFDVMPRNTEPDWETIATRLELVPSGLDSVKASLSETTWRGLPPPRRQVQACAEQGATWAGQRQHQPYFSLLVANYRGDDDALKGRLEAAAEAATRAYGTLSAWLRDELAPLASPRDAVGRDRYALASAQTLGATVDPEEAYRWGWDELHRLETEMSQVADQVVAGASVPEAIAFLESDPERAIEGEDRLRSFLQDLMDKTIAELDGTHFDIPGPLKKVEAMIAPPGGAAAMYYTGPSEDFSRPGRTWYPTLGKTTFPLWGEISICYHEGVPGHHLQIGQVRYLKDELSRFQRMAWMGSHGEGWALYAERLMDELGYFENPDYRLGFLRAQVMRAVRVVVDIGMHLELRIPADDKFHPGEQWTPAVGEEFLFERSCFPRDFMASELDRYLGWPSQATCYKLGERVWLSSRDDVRYRLGASFDLKAFHAYALGLGPLGLDQLASELAAFGRPDRPASTRPATKRQG
jgi:uncharacterized protein (DUF885 family)